MIKYERESISKETMMIYILIAYIELYKPILHKYLLIKRLYIVVNK
jgi:hypothetical protein